MRKVLTQEIDSKQSQTKAPLPIQSSTEIKGREKDMVADDDKTYAEEDSGISINCEEIPQNTGFCIKCGNEVESGANLNDGVMEKISTELMPEHTENDEKRKKVEEASTKIQESSKGKQVDKKGTKVTIEDEEDESTKSSQQGNGFPERKHDENVLLEEVGEFSKEEHVEKGEETREREKEKLNEDEKEKHIEPLMEDKNFGEQQRGKDNEGSKGESRINDIDLTKPPDTAVAAEVRIDQNNASKETNSTQSKSESSILQGEDLTDVPHDQMNQSICSPASRLETVELKPRRLQPDDVWSEVDCQTLEYLMSNYNDHKWHHMQAGFFNRTGRMISSEIIRRKFYIDGIQYVTNATVTVTVTIGKHKSVFTDEDKKELLPIEGEKEEHEMFLSRLENYNDRNNAAHSALLVGVSEELQELVCSCDEEPESARVAMRLLKEKYDYETTTSTIQLFKEFCELKMEEGESISNHISQFETAYAHIYSRCASSS
ncbi:hypothetical protein K3495_g2759 [Podosphaera aphanis]|nr:hypothetical protein K3495_g2759 [Podosphaera aphanis]